MVKRYIRMIIRSWSTLLCFELLYKAIGFMVIGPLLRFILLNIPAVSDLTWISQENVAAALGNPKAAALLFLTLIIAAAYVYFELAALILYCDGSWRGERMQLWTLWKDTFRQWIRFFLPYNLPVFLMVLPALALSVLPLTSGALSAVKVPEFILEFIRQKPALSALYGLLLAAFNLAGLYFLLGMPFAVLHRERFSAAWRKSGALLKGKKLKALLTLVLCFVLAVSAAFFAAAVTVFALFVYVRFTAGGEEAFRFLIGSWARTGRIAGSILGPVVLAAVSVFLYHSYRGDIPAPAAPAVRTMKKFMGRTAMVIVTVFLLFFFSETVMGGAREIPEGKSTLIIAHRAGAVFAPENTVAALEQAVKDGADMAEIDVQQTGDGVLIIMHDSNFKRTAGVDLNVWDADYDQVRGLDAGVLTSTKYAGEPIPSLEDMLLAARGRIKLMIELKSTGHEIGLVGKTVEAIRSMGMESECLIASMDLSILREARRLAPELQTVYISAILLSRQYEMKYVDGYSVETTSLTPEMDAKIHAQGKKLYIWTANSASNIRRILRSGADGLVTDNPALARYYLDAGNENLFADMLVEWFFPDGMPE